MADLILYGSDGCHLCEEAEYLLQQLGVTFQKQDILNDDAAYQRYAVKIPVLFDAGDGAELNWPFGAEQICAFLVGR